jgi:hypothetical protein
MMRAGRGLAIEARRAARGRRFDPTVAQTSQTLGWALSVPKIRPCNNSDEVR